MLQLTAWTVSQAAPVFVPDTSVTRHGRAPCGVSLDRLPTTFNRSTLAKVHVTEDGNTFMRDLLDVDRMSDYLVMTDLWLSHTPFTHSEMSKSETFPRIQLRQKD